MSLTVKDSGGGGEFKKVPQGSHIAVCDMVVDVGIQPSGFGPKHKVYLRFEVPGERMTFKKDGEEKEGPMVIGSFYTASLGEMANLRKHLESWRGKAFTPEELKGFDLFNVLGKPCMITVLHKQGDGKTYANITGITALPKGVTAPKAEIPLVRYSPESPDGFEALPSWLQEKIGGGTKGDYAPAEVYAEKYEDDSVPF